MRIEVSGNAYTRGLQYGRAAKREISENVDTYKSLFSDAGITWEAAQQTALKFINAFDPFIQEIEGLSDGSGVSVTDILTLHCRSEILLCDGCTAFAKDGYLSQNWDWKATMHVCVLVTPEFTTVTECGMLAKVGMNHSGLGVTLNALKSRGLDYAGLPIHVALRIVLECKSTDEAISKIGRVASAAHLLLADTNGAIGLEVGPAGVAKLRDDGNGVFHTNHCLLPNARELPWLHDSVPRLDRVKELVGQIDQLDEDSIFEVYKDEEGFPNSINRAVDESGKGGSGISTVFNIIMHLKTRRMRVSMGRPTHVTQVYDLVV